MNTGTFMGRSEFKGEKLMVEEKIRHWEMNAGRTIFGHICPECGVKMEEAERVSENGFIFVWYECSRPGCNGQWLEKKMMNTSVESMSTMRPAHIFSAVAEK
jgi:hypothetical protein